ncbi:MAG TPA: phosphodiester glycosidase family protein [Armatimonadota bacterium]|nr:phosphodiester glycosidase family protein [Armatimonadota bacterium]
MKRLIIIVLSIACAACATRAFSSSIAYRKQVVLSVPVHVVYVNLNDPSVKVTVAISQQGRGSSETASSIIQRTKPAAAITGTFFDTRTLLPTGDIAIGGTRIHSGCVGPALCVSSKNYADIIPHKYRARRWTGSYETVLAGGPTLVDAGQVSVNARAEGFRDPSIFRPATRTAVGITTANKLLMVSVNTPISQHKLAKIMVSLGAYKAMMLDGGSSTAMYVNGHFVSKPARKLTNLLLVYKSQEDYMQAASQLAPTLLTANRLAASVESSLDGEGNPVDSSWSTMIAASAEKDNLQPLKLTTASLTDIASMLLAVSRSSEDVTKADEALPYIDYTALIPPKQTSISDERITTYQLGLKNLWPEVLYRN